MTVKKLREYLGQVSEVEEFDVERERVMQTLDSIAQDVSLLREDIPLDHFKEARAALEHIRAEINALVSDLNWKPRKTRQAGGTAAEQVQRYFRENPKAKIGLTAISHSVSASRPAVAQALRKLTREKYLLHEDRKYRLNPDRPKG